MASRKPVEILELKGAYKKILNAEDHRLLRAKRGLGNFEHLDETEQAIWYEIISICAPSVLVSSDLWC
jgi:hypothetical protein